MLPEYMLTYPTVFAVADKYNIFVPFSDEVIMYVKVGERKYYDHCNGILRSNTNMHKVELPCKVLDEAGAVIEAEVAIQHGLWMQTILDFLIIAFSIFVAVRILRHAEKLLHAREAAKEAEAKAAAEAAAREAAEKEEKIKAAIAAREAEKEKLLADYYKRSEEQTQLLADIKELLKNK